jgi:Co/Zn/Cd efflux system component
LELLALVANGVCFALLWRHRADDINMSSVWLCSRNDLIANSAVILAAVGVWLTHTAWPDIVVGLAIAALFAKSAFTVLAGSAYELRHQQV